VSFLVDAQLPPALARWIAGQGHQAAHVFDLGFHRADDPVIWERALNEHAAKMLHSRNSMHFSPCSSRVAQRLRVPRLRQAGRLRHRSLR